MASITRDPLLGFARALLMFFIAVLSIAIAALAVAAPIVLITQDSILAAINAKGSSAGPEFIALACVLIAALAALLALGIYFLLLLHRIVLSVGEGEPFTPENAARLARMGWVCVAEQVASIPVGGLGSYIARVAADAGEDVDVQVGIGGSGIILILTLFILARVFRKGAEMRADLEGTV